MSAPASRGFAANIARSASPVALGGTSVSVLHAPPGAKARIGFESGDSQPIHTGQVIRAPAGQPFTYFHLTNEAVDGADRIDLVICNGGWEVTPPAAPRVADTSAQIAVAIPAGDSVVLSPWGAPSLARVFEVHIGTDADTMVQVEAGASVAAAYARAAGPPAVLHLGAGAVTASFTLSNLGAAPALFVGFVLYSAETGADA